MFNGKGWWVKQTCHGINGCDFQWERPDEQPGVEGHAIGAVFGQMYGPPGISTLLNGNGTAYLYTARTWDGATHQMFQRTSTGGGMVTMDNTGISSDGSPTTQLPTWARTRDGSLYTLSSGQYEDSNGNYYNRTVDTMGRSLTFSTSSADNSGCAGPLPISSATITNYPGYNGGSLQVKTCSATLALSTNFQEAKPDGEIGMVAEYTGTATVLQSLVLCNDPSGTCSDWTARPNWVFAYDSYGDIIQVTLPTGGTISYGWGIYGQCPDIALTQVSNFVFSRTVDDGNGPKTTTFSPSFQTTTVTDPLGNQTVHTFTALGGGCSYYETQTDWYQGHQDGGTRLKTVSTAYQFLTTLAGDGMTTVAYNVEPITITTKWPLPNNQTMQSSITKNYDGNLTSGTVTGSYGKVTDEYVYDYDGALLRKTHYDYLAFSNSSYMNQNLLDLTTSETLYDGTGTNEIAQTTYGYDEYQLASSGITTQHAMNVPNPGARGNRTSVHRWLDTGGTPTTTTTYYDTGKPYQVTDPGGHATTYTYSSGYVGAYVTQTNFPDTGSPAVHHVISGLYDFNTGLLTSFTDQNGKVSTYGYDALSRIRSASFPDGGQTTFVPTDTPLAVNIERRDKIDASNWTDTYAKFDGLGRLIRKMTANGEGTPWDQVDTCYDADARVSFTSYAYQGNGLSDPQRCSGVGDSFAYDALNRTLSVTHSDGSVINTAYTGPATQVTDEGNGTSRVQRTSQVDALGRLTYVCEVTGAALIGITPTPDNCGLNMAISATGFLTHYQYTYQGHDLIMSVSQGGLNQRSFTYDTLSRLISATNPEAGTTSYTYNSDSLLYQRTRPAPNQTNPALTETTTYTYDALHRLTGQTYSPNASGTSTVTIAYDQSSAFGVALTNPIGRKSSEFTTGLSGTLSGAVYSYDEMGRVLTNSQCTPQNCGTSVFPVTYLYDKTGDMTSGTNGMGTTLTYGYNIAPRLTSLTSSLSDSNHPGTLFSGAHYNPAGALLSTALGNGLNETRSYDSRLRLTSIAAGAVYNVTIPSQNGYAPNGDILAANDSVNGNWTYTYDDFNRLLGSNQNSGQAVYSYDYDRFGNRWHQNLTAGSGRTSILSFDANNHVAADNGVSYDAAGNVTNDGFHSYMYDDENRLTGVDVSPGSPPTPGTGTVTISGAEQRKNNCLAPVGGFSSPGASPQSCPWIYDYGSVSITINGYRQSVPFSQGSTASGIASGLINAFNGDPASPVTASGGTTITFTSKQVGSGSNYAFSTSVTYDTHDFTQASFAATPTSGSLTGGTNGTPPGTPNYFYDAEGRRIRKTTAGGTVDYIYDLAGHVVSEVSSAGGWNRGEVYAGGRHLATYMGGTGGSTYFTFADWLGNERVRTNPNGSIYSTWTNLPFGEGSSSPNPGTTHFTGKERDTESNLDYFGARYYGNSMGRWMSADWGVRPTAVPSAQFGNPQTLNLYLYVGNNPVLRVDLDGHCWPPSACAEWVMSKVNQAQAWVQNKAVASGSPTLAATATFASGVARDVVNGLANLGTVGKATGAVIDSGSTAQKAVAITQDLGKAGGIALIGVGLAAGLTNGAAASNTTALSTFRYTAEGETFTHYGYAADASNFASGLRPGSFATTESGLTGAEAQSGLALPHATPPDAAYTVTPGEGTLIDVNPVAQPEFGQPGGLPEVNFPLGTGTGTVSGPRELPE